MFNVTTRKTVASYSAKFAAVGAFAGSLLFGRKGAVGGAAVGGFVGNGVGQFKADRLTNEDVEESTTELEDVVPTE